MKQQHLFWLTVWYKKSVWRFLLIPLTIIFVLLSALRKFYLVQCKQQKLPVPVIVIGNISVGGTGKTPLIIALVNYLKTQGHNPGVVSRGYGGKAANYPFVLDEASSVELVGDEPMLIFTATKAPVCVAPDRVAAAKKLIELGCTHILSDDGLQHYQLGRSLEIAVVDGERLFGNGYRLPSGPLREPLSRLNTVDMIVVNSGVATTPSLAKFKNTYSMQIQPLGWRHLVSNKLMQLQDVAFQSPIFAVAGIGNPERYFKTLSALSLTFKPMSFADHHAYQLEDFSICAESDVVMTEKDAVKCAAFARQNWYALSVGAQLDSHFWQDFQTKLDSLSGS